MMTPTSDPFSAITVTLLSLRSLTLPDSHNPKPTSGLASSPYATPYLVMAKQFSTWPQLQLPGQSLPPPSNCQSVGINLPPHLHVIWSQVPLPEPLLLPMIFPVSCLLYVFLVALWLRTCFWQTSPPDLKKNLPNIANKYLCQSSN